MTEIKKQTFGVEIEMVGIGNHKGANVLAGLFGTTSFYRGEGYDKWCAKDQKGRTWTCMNDGSLNGSVNTELVTPILTWDDIELLQEVVRAMRNAGGKADSSCGVHVHVGASEHTPATLKNLLNLVYTHYDLLEKALKFSARKRWCNKPSELFLQQINHDKPMTEEELAQYWYGTSGGNSYSTATYSGKVSKETAGYKKHSHYDSSRYQLVNLHSYYQGKGVEFRAFNGTVHAGEIKAYVQFCCALNAKAINLSKSSMKDVETGRTDKHEMKHWLKVLGMNGKDAEFKTCRFHMTKNLAD